ncbi:MAG: alpha/beta hydrolase-fold protein [Candidatus Binatia bacterium]
MSSALVAQVQAEKAPLVSGEQATFVWTGEHAPILVGDMTGWRPWEEASGGQKMEEVEPGVWSCTLTLPSDAYVEYVYLVNGQRSYDPFNRHRVPNGFGEYNNCFWMPHAPHSPMFRRRRGVPAGTVRQQMFHSMRLANGRRNVRLYQPALEGPYTLLLVLDGKDYFQRAKLTTLVDNLLHEKSLPPLVIAFLDNAQASRFAEYGCSEALVGFVAQELIPWVASQVPLVSQMGTHCVLGASLGGLAALWLGARLPEIFGRVFSQAGGFALGFTKELGLTTILRVGERLPLRIYMDCGRFDPLLEANQMMHGLLASRGYEVTYHEFNAGHNYPAWREDLATGLLWLLQPKEG